MKVVGFKVVSRRGEYFHEEIEEIVGNVIDGRDGSQYHAGIGEQVRELSMSSLPVTRSLILKRIKTLIVRTFPMKTKRLRKMKMQTLPTQKRQILSVPMIQILQRKKRDRYPRISWMVI